MTNRKKCLLPLNISTICYPNHQGHYISSSNKRKSHSNHVKLRCVKVKRLKCNYCLSFNSYRLNFCVTGEHLTEQFKETVNRFQKVPCIVDNNDFKLSESVAIFRYLAEKNHTIADHWYPKDSKKQALVDEYLEWQHNNTRLTCSVYFQLKYLRPLMFGKEARQDQVDEYRNRMIGCLDTIETVWLKDTKFLVGNEISVADLLGACEIEQLQVTDYNPFEGRPKLTAWIERVRNATKPDYDDAHKYLRKLAEKTNAPKNKL